MTDTTNKRKGGWWALSPLAVFLCLYLVTSLIVNCLLYTSDAADE